MVGLVRLSLGLGLGALIAGPFDIPLRNTARAPNAKGSARLVFAPSPFGVTVTADGRASYDLLLTLSGLPEPSSLGAYKTYVAWVASPDLRSWAKLGAVTNGESRVGRAEMNKFLVVITAEADSTATSRAGPTVLNGSSPSTWLQTFLSHPLFRGIPPS
jgi:hypothetical protein